ncbi:unnamed protein product [Urochloa decumbens]|uniref:Factor of DNA methylation 1-5/IDN2 domain-containing protein n=1 Tax=Urochloa decumbens TaxID=240449 RepID=A0ABC8ZBB7_9POAL
MSTNDVLMADAEAHEAGELLVWPWTGILAMTDAAATLAVHAHRLFSGVATTALQEEPKPINHHHCQQHFLLLHFGKSWSGLRDAMSLAAHFAGAGRAEWRRHGDGDGEGTAGGVVFGWAAVESDLLGGGAVARFLRESGAAARSVEDVEKDEAIGAAKLAAVAGEYERREGFLAAKNEEMVKAVRRMAEEISWLQDELKELKDVADSCMPEIMNHGADEENEMLRAALDEIKGEIELCVERIQELKECSRTDQHYSRVEKEEMEAINAKVIQLEKQLEQKEAQESAICLLNTKLQAGENLRMEDYQQLITISKECLEKRCERFQNAYVDLTRRDHLNRDELQETRQEVIKCVESMMIGDCTVIGIKRMGQLDEKPLHYACKRKYRDDNPEEKAARLVSSWQEELKNKSWNPFTTILVDGEEKDVVNEEDPKLTQLRTEYGDSVCNAVKVALRELNEYSPQGRHAVNELWNFREGRKATMAEVVKYIFGQLKTSR